MSSNMHQVAKKLNDILTESDKRKPKAYDTKAKVTHIEGRTAWVMVPGSTNETPVQRTNNANPGDEVIVRFSGGRAWLLGNNTNPATDDKKASAAEELAIGAGNMADVARKSAEIAQENADYAKARAADAETYADQAFTEAQRASTEATNAQRAANEANDHALDAYASANSALVSLSNVEQVVDTLDWISSHAAYHITTDTTPVPGTMYYTVEGTKVIAPTDAGCETYYELVDGVYSKTEETEIRYFQTQDSSIVSGKTYYTSAAVSTPKKEQLSTYYELTQTDPIKILERTKDTVVDGTKSYWTISAVQNPTQSELTNYYELKQFYTVVGTPITLSEITADKYYLTEDQSVVSGKLYFTAETVIEPQQVDIRTYYELDGTVIFATTDLLLDLDKTYYTVSQVSTPVSEDLSTYYERHDILASCYNLDVRSALSSYVQSHVALTNEGLYLLKDGSPYKILIADDGIVLYEAGKEIARYGKETIVGNVLEQHIVIGQNATTGKNRLSFMDGQIEVAYIDNQELHIPKAVVVYSLQIGDWRFVERDNKNLTLYWIGE